MMLYKLLSSMNQSRFESTVVSMMDKGSVGARIEALGIPVYELGMINGRPTIGAMWRLIRLLRSLEPDIIQGWMYHGNISALLVKIFIAKHPPVLWNIRQTLYSMEKEKWLTQLVIRTASYLSAMAARIIYNSRVSTIQHETIGYRSGKRIILSNGFDIKRFCPSVDTLNIKHQALGFDENTLVIGLFARYHPMKDHTNFINAANIVYLTRPDVHYVLVGRNVSSSNPDMLELVNASAARDNFHLLGERSDIPELMAAIDIAVVSSAWGEGFSNALGEAMACGTPCVVTDVGDSAWILGESSGEVVAPRDPDALAAGMLKLLNMEKEKRRALGHNARQRIVDEFSIEKIAHQYEVLYEQVYAEYNSKG